MAFPSRLGNGAALPTFATTNGQLTLGAFVNAGQMGGWWWLDAASFLAVNPLGGALMAMPAFGNMLAGPSAALYSPSLIQVLQSQQQARMAALTKKVC